ncbi:glycosyltransferase family A protein [uncultured Mameliella sp.]|uniref:glycosyltransferase family A protein n=1 Tax=uncultured Mameliella sp. TaxID=1447087 RepID=UPI00262F73F7|nr:glycosyltransferase family A protein [uncultured Mameliella sp.]
MTDQTATPLVPSRVSLIVPSYNVEAWLEDFIASVVAQTYKDLEVILVNDGANEATTEGLRAAVPGFEAEGYLVRLIEQDNKGLGGACDTGLKHFTGEFLMWPDPDDWLLPNSVERRVALMRANPEVGLLRTNARLWIEAKGEYDGHFMPPEGETRLAGDLFENLLILRKFHAPVCHMVRSEMFLQVHPDRSIWFGPRSSQNFQMLVPFVERFPVLEVPSEVLAGYRVREDSRSRAPGKSRDKLMSRFDQLFELAGHTMPKLRTATPERLERMNNFHWRNRMLPTAFRAGMKDRCRELVVKSALGAGRKAVARWLIAIRCTPAFGTLDARTGRIASRALARSFDRLVMVPPDQLGWGTGPLWSADRTLPSATRGGAGQRSFEEVEERVS